MFKPLHWEALRQEKKTKTKPKMSLGYLVLASEETLKGQWGSVSRTKELAERGSQAPNLGSFEHQNLILNIATHFQEIESNGCCFRESRMAIIMEMIWL